MINPLPGLASGKGRSMKGPLDPVLIDPDAALAPPPRPPEVGVAPAAFGATGDAVDADPPPSTVDDVGFEAAGVAIDVGEEPRPKIVEGGAAFAMVFGGGLGFVGGARFRGVICPRDDGEENPPAPGNAPPPPPPNDDAGVQGCAACALKASSGFGRVFSQSPGSSVAGLGRAAKIVMSRSAASFVAVAAGRLGGVGCVAGSAAAVADDRTTAGAAFARG
jgi:hypothetical protein